MAEQKKQTKEQYLPDSVTKLIAHIIKKMRYRKSVRADVERELTDYFCDELRECTSDEQQDKKAIELIAEFGDPVMLAILLRRAKKRCRAPWRTAVVRTCQAVGAAIVLLVVYAVWFASGDPTISTDYLAIFNEMNRPKITDTDNAWPGYEKAIEAYVEPFERIQDMGRWGYSDRNERVSFDDLDEEEQQQIKQWLGGVEAKWDGLNADLRKIVEAYIEHGLVPGFAVPGGDVLGPSDFWMAIDSIRVRVHRNHGKTQPRRDLDLEEMQRMQDIYGTGLYGWYGRESFALDANLPLDGRLIDWAKANEAIAKGYELQDAIDAGAARYWIDHPPASGKDVIDKLLPYQIAELKRWVADNDPAWQYFSQASRKTYCHRAYTCGDNTQEPWLMGITLPHLSPFRRLARMARWRMQFACESGDIRAALSDCLTLARAGAHFQGKGTIIEQLVGMAVSRLAHTEGIQILRDYDVSAEDLKWTSEQLAQLYAEGYPLMNLEGENLVMMDAIQNTFTSGGPGGGHLIPARFMQLGSMYIEQDSPEEGFDRNLALAGYTALGIYHARRDDTVALAKKLSEHNNKVARMSPYQQHVEKVKSVHELLPSGKLGMAKYALIGYLLPATSRASILAFDAKVSHEVMVTILAVKRWHLAHGVCPPDLATLVKDDYLRQLPADPYSDKPLVYRKTDEGFTLYSLGEGFADDGGKVAYSRSGEPITRGGREGADVVYWPVPERRSD